ncbi:MAG: lipopolysaccharide biosynthesis protein [Candidatus Hermodarchaeota archaeon]
MKNENSEIDLTKSSSEYKKFATNAFFSFLVNYGSHFFTFVYSFLLARLITDESWDFLIVATSYITIIAIVINFLPPGLEHALNYYIPRYLALNQKSKIKSLIKNAFLIKLIFMIPIVIISLIGFLLFADIFSVNLENKIILLYLLFPLIITNSSKYVLDAINRGFSQFNILIILLLIRNAIHVSPLLIYYLFDIPITVEIIALIVMISSIAPFILSFLYILTKIIKIKPENNDTLSFKEDISNSFKFGRYIGISDLIDKMWRETQLQGISIFASAGDVTGYNIGLKYRNISLFSVTSFRFPLLTSFSSLNTKERHDQVIKIYKITSKVTLFILLIISGFLFFAVDFFIDFIFLEDRLIYSNFLRLLVIATTFRILGYFVQTLLNAQFKVKFSFLLNILYMSYTIPLFFLGLYYFGVEMAIFLGLILGNIISLIIQIFFSKKYGNVELNKKKIIIQYITFFIPLGITIILERLIFKEASLILIQDLGLSLFKNFDFYSIGTFLVLFILMNLVLKTVTRQDISSFQTLLNEKRFIDRILIKILNILKKLTRKH